ncbi:MAG: hypothetical protein J6P58_09135 [Oscillospiraceae bacterium]|nr:hypothetical protein [Oscillospiraceae bacterium]
MIPASCANEGRQPIRCLPFRRKNCSAAGFRKDSGDAIAEAQGSVRFCFVGPAGLSSFRLSSTDAEAIRQTLETYDAMLAAGVQPMP